MITKTPITTLFLDIGGVAAIRQYLTAGLVDEVHLAMAPALLGSGEQLLVGIDMVRLGYKCTKHASSDHATNTILNSILWNNSVEQFSFNPATDQISGFSVVCSSATSVGRLAL